VIEDRAGDRRRDAAGDSCAATRCRPQRALLSAGKASRARKGRWQDQGFANPCTNRPTMSGAKLGAKPIAVAPRPKRAIPARKIRFCRTGHPSAGDQGQGASGRSFGVHHPLQSSGARRISRPIAASATVTTALLTNTRSCPGSTRRVPLCCPARDGLRLGERQAAVGQDQGRAAHDLIPRLDRRFRGRASRSKSSDQVVFTKWRLVDASLKSGSR